MRVRLLGTIAFLVPFIALVWADFHYNLGSPCVWLYWLALAAAQLSAAELYPLLAPAELLPSRRNQQLVVLLVMLGTAVPVYYPLLTGNDYPPDCPVGRLGCTLFGLILALAVAIGQQMAAYREPRATAVTKAALLVFSATYLGVLTSFLVLLRTFHSNGWGMAALVSMVAIVKVSDIGAYVAGRFTGRHQMAPLLSPKKTIEGAIGGVVAAIAMALAVPFLLLPSLVGRPAAQSQNLVGWAVLGLLLCFAGMAGDLAESLIKRDSAKKDSSRWLPGLGGMLDLMDSMLSAAPVAYAAWSVGLVGPG